MSIKDTFLEKEFDLKHLLFVLNEILDKELENNPLNK